MKKILRIVFFIIGLAAFYTQAFSQGFTPIVRDSVQAWGSRANALKLTYDNYIQSEIFRNLAQGTATTSVSGNWLRGDSATAQQNKLILSQTENISGNKLMTGDILYAGLYAGINAPAPYNSLFKDNNNYSVFSRWGSLNSYFIDTVSGSRKSTAEHLRLINTKLAATLTVTAQTATTTVTYSYVTSSGTNTVTAGAKMVSVCNTGGNNATFNGGTLPPGSCVTLPMMEGIVRPQITYDCLTSSLTVVVER